MSNKNAHVLVGGDFNCGNIEWSTMQVPEGVPNRRVQNQLLEIAQDHCLSQVVNIHTRKDKTLDLLLTNSPSPVNRVKGMPPIGKADNDIVYVEYDIKAKRIQQAREIFSSITEQTWMVFVTTLRDLETHSFHLTTATCQ